MAADSKSHREELSSASAGALPSNGEGEAIHVLTEQELEQRLLAACNGLRGPVDPTDYKAYIFPLLFLKRISDKWDWEYRRAVEKFDGDQELALLEENFQFVIPEGCHWDDVRKLAENIGAGLHKILQRIEQANPEALAGIFGDVQWANKDKLPEPALKNVLKEFSSLKLDPEHAPGDVLGAAYEYLLKYFADESGKKAGEFFTPRSVVRLLTLILDPKEGESVHDPTCGSGGMLVEMVNVVREHEGDPRTLKLSGQEVSLTTAAIARMNIFLHDIDDFRIRRGDTLRDPKFKTPKGDLEKFDIVIANPPFSLNPWGHDVWAEDPYGRSKFGVPPATKGDFAFVEHMLTVTKSGSGRLAVVMPQGVLFRGGVEKEIRRRLVEAGVIKAIVGLPPNLFYNTSLPACVLVLGAADTQTKSVLFVDASRSFVKQGARNELRATDIEAIRSAVASKGAEPTGDVVARIADQSDIAANSWDLNLGRYVGGVAADVIDVSSAVSDYLTAADALSESEAGLRLRLSEAGLLGE
jgi:type I restriction enzyme M protein